MVEPPARAARADPIRLIAQVLCVIFGLIGTLPLAAEALLRVDALERWASRETARLLQEHLGLTASYEVQVHLIPLAVEVKNLVVPASDGGSPALTTERLRVRPRIFGLLAGQLDVGDVEVQAPRARLVVRDGKLVNVRYRLPKTSERPRTSKQAPFSSLSVTDARIVADIDGVQIDTGTVDLDVFGETGPTFEVMLSAQTGTLRRERALPDQPVSVDEDVICRIEMRARVAEQAILIRRLAAIAVADQNGAPKTQPSCDAGEEVVGRVAVRLSQVRATLREGDLPDITGHVVTRAPLSLVNRFARAPALKGWAGFAGDVRFDRSARLPQVRGRVSGAGIGIEEFRIASYLGLDLSLAGDVIHIPKLELGFSDGHVVAENSRIEPLEDGVPMSVGRFEAKGIVFETMMRDLDVTPDTIIRWNLTNTRVLGLKGTLNPVTIDGDLSAETRDFEVFDRAYHDKARQHVVGVRNATIRGKIGVRPNALVIYDTRTDFGKSAMFVKQVWIGFDNQLKVQVTPGSKLNLADISPLLDIPMAGLAELDVNLAGEGSDPLLTGNIKIAGFEFGGFPLGDVKSAKAKFRPLWLELAEVHGQKGQSAFYLPTARLDFGTRASMVVDAHAKSASLDLRDFFHMWHFDEDPRFADLKGTTAVDAKIRYVLGGPEDRCSGGILRATGKLDARALSIFEEHYDGGSGTFDFVWNDRDATYRGVSLDVPEFSLRKGSGTITGKLQMSPGAQLKGEFYATAVPIGKLDALPTMVRAAKGTASASGLVSGTLDALEMEASATVTPLQIGGSTLRASTLLVRLVPIVHPERTLGTSGCGQPISGPFDPAEYERDLAAGVFHVDAALLGGQILLQDLAVTRQRKKIVTGTVTAANLDVGALTEFVPELALSKPRAHGSVSGSIKIEELPMESPSLARGTLDLKALAIERGGMRVELVEKAAPMRYQDKNLALPSTTVAVTSPGGQPATLDVAGTIQKLSTIDATLALHPVPLAGFVGVLPRVERGAGILRGQLRLTGPLRAPRAAGGFQVERGELALRGLPTALSGIDLAVSIDGNELKIQRGSMRFGNGTISLSGGAPLNGFSLGEARIRIAARELTLPAKEGVRAMADADLMATYRPGVDADGEQRLPRVTGNVVLRSAEYRRAVTMAADLNALAQRGKRTVFDSYDPSEDALEFDINVKAQRSISLNNDLVEAELTLSDEGLQLAGTNARYGARGTVRVKPGGRIFLRRSEFEITEGTIRFDDLTRIAPRVDVTAVTEYRRYSDAPSGGSAGGATTASASTSASGGRWNIRMHAYGDADNLHVDLTSDPALPQDDIFLLLTVGLTRAELDQARSASVGESVALEALGTLTGADRAVKDALPLIDEFRFGSAYSSRTGRTEPTVTVGKRLTERVRANVTSGLSESREIRSNLEWRLSPRVSVEGSYDNVNDIGSSSLGNLGADIRWRLEFE